MNGTRQLSRCGHTEPSSRSIYRGSVVPLAVAMCLATVLMVGGCKRGSHREDAKGHGMPSAEPGHSLEGREEDTATVACFGHFTLESNGQGESSFQVAVVNVGSEPIGIPQPPTLDLRSDFFDYEDVVSSLQDKDVRVPPHSRRFLSMDLGRPTVDSDVSQLEPGNAAVYVWRWPARNMRLGRMPDRVVLTVRTEWREGIDWGEGRPPTLRKSESTFSYVPLN